MSHLTDAWLDLEQGAHSLAPAPTLRKADGHGRATALPDVWTPAVNPRMEYV